MRDLQKKKPRVIVVGSNSTVEAMEKLKGATESADQQVAASVAGRGIVEVMDQSWKAADAQQLLNKVATAGKDVAEAELVEQHYKMEQAAKKK